MNINTILQILDIEQKDNIDDVLNSIIMYLRKSRKDMDYYKDESIEKTLARHEKELQDVIKRTFGKELPEKNIFREVASGDTIEDRPVMQEVLTEIENPNIKAVICIEIERLARGNTIDQGTIAQTFKYTNTKIWTPMKIYNLDSEDDLSYFEDGLYQARKYLVYTKRILNRGRIRSVKEGKYISSTRAYGYNKKKLINEKGFTLEINEDEARIVRMIFDLAYNGKGTSLICNELNGLGIKPMRNDVWTPACVRNILKNQIYISKVTWGRRKTVSSLKQGNIIKSRPVCDNYLLIDALHESIIDKELFYKVQEVLDKKSGNRIKNDYKLKNPLAGLIKCGVCGRKMIRRPYSNKYPDFLICSLAHCTNISSNLHLVEAKLIEGLNITLSEYKNKAILYETTKIDITNAIDVLTTLEKEIERINNQITRACELLEQNIYNTDMFLKRKHELETKKEETLKKIEEAKRKHEEEKQNNVTKMIVKLENCLSIYDKLNVEEKHELLSTIIEDVEYIKTKGGRGFEDNFILKIRTKL